MSVRPYLRAFSMGVAQEFAYPINFLFGRFRNILLLVLVYYVWIEIAGSVDFFSGYSGKDLVAYVFLAHVVRSFVIGNQVRIMAYEIYEGTFSKYLTQPIHYALFHLFREFGGRVIQFVSALFETFLFLGILGQSLLVFISPQIIIRGGVILLLAFILYFFLSFTANLFAFWSREAMGPLFFFDWFMEFSSGAFFPLTIVGPLFTSIVLTLPFAYTVFLPVSVVLNPDIYTFGHTALIICVWIITAVFCSWAVFHRGLKHYSGEGI